MERMDIEAAKKKLYNAAKSGDVAKFQEVLQEDPYILDEVSYACSRTVLHIATLHGQPAIVEQVLNINPQLARDLDSNKSSFLHFAAAQGRCLLARKLLAIAPETLWWRDWQDMNPIHIAAMNGHIEVLQMMLYQDPSPAMERMHRGQTVLHLCIKHYQLRPLKVLAKKLGDLVRAKDDDGETILHLAVRSNQLDAIQYLVEVTGVIKKDVRNSMGKTALDILLEIPRFGNFSEIQNILQKMSHQPVMESVKLTEVTLVLVVLIATLAFQISINPPGGVWQDDNLTDTPSLAPAPVSDPGSIYTSSHRAGGAIMASANSSMYTNLVACCILALSASLVTIFLIITGLPSRHNAFMWLALASVWVSVSSVASSCVVSMLFIANPGRLPLDDFTMLGINMAIYAAGILPMGYLRRWKPSD